MAIPKPGLRCMCCGEASGWPTIAGEYTIKQIQAEIDKHESGESQCRTVIDRNEPGLSIKIVPGDFWRWTDTNEIVDFRCGIDIAQWSIVR